MINVDMFDRSEPGNILATLETTFEIGETSSIGSPLENEDIRLYPNPTRDYFRVYQAENVATIDVHNVVGRKVLTFNASENGEYDVSNLPDGMYVVRLLSKQNAVLKTLRLSKS